ncbi:MAG: class I SAM-dependent methyltransferase [Stellaceae bacterium]|jgi:hypothetical protein
MYSRIADTFRECVRNPGYRQYLRLKFWHLSGYNFDQWARVVYSREWREFLNSLPLKSLKVLEISPRDRFIVEPGSVLHHRSVNFPEFDITRNVLSEKFDLIIAEQVFEHLRHPYKAAGNVRKMLNDKGIFLVATPFLIKVHKEPGDYTRWTSDGLRGFLEDCGFTCEVNSWGNRKAVKANFESWRAYGWKRDLSNEPDFPVCVWAYARKSSSNESEE